MEECNGGTLEEKIINSKGKKFEEKIVSEIMEIIFEAVNHIHHQNICHRDLKPENILFQDSEDIRSLKLIDFGLGKSYAELDEINKFVGSPQYVAPEILKGGEDIKCDVWSAGVIMYSLLSGQMPFTGKTQEEMYKEIKKEEACYPPKCKFFIWKDFSFFLFSIKIFGYFFLLELFFYLLVHEFYYFIIF